MKMQIYSSSNCIKLHILSENHFFAVISVFQSVKEQVFSPDGCFSGFSYQKSAQGCARREKALSLPRSEQIINTIQKLF
jgi:hypothetical protein